MPSPIADTFMSALQQVELSHNVEPLVGLFADDAELRSPAREVTKTGPEGARQFWREYLSAFHDVRSEFTKVSEGDDFAILEWTGSGTLPNGEPIRYPGVSVLEFRDGKVNRFRTYYDSAAFLPHGSKHHA